MYSIVKCLRQNGIRRPDREIQADEGTVGHLSLVNCGAHYELKLHGAGDDAVKAPIVPILYNAVAVTMMGNRMLWSGDERESPDPRGRTVKQEWSVMLAVEAPVEVPQPTTRLG